MTESELDITRESVRVAGATLREQLGIPAQVHDAPAPGWPALSDELVFGTIWARPGFALIDRMTAVLPVLCALERERLIGPYVSAALRLGIAPTAIRELFIQASLYAGFHTAEVALGEAQSLLETAEEQQPTASTAETLDGLERDGRAKMAVLHGSRASGGYAAPDHPTSGGLYQIALRYGYGELWHRPGLQVRERFICAVATFTALGLDAQLVKFAESARNNGLAQSEIIEIVMQTAPYAGFPRALNGLAVLG